MRSQLSVTEKLELLHRQEGVSWGLFVFDTDQFSTNHKLVVGMPGSGKTLTFSMVMLSQLAWPHAARKPGIPQEKTRARVFQSIVYDSKSEQVPRLMAHGFSPGVDLFVLDPFNTAAMVWDIASDITDYAASYDFADLVIAGLAKPETYSGTSEHFQETARSVVIEVVQVLQRTPKWRLRDFINCFSSRERLESVIKQHPQGGHSLEHIKKNDEGASTISTIKRHIRRLTLVAAAWDAIEQREGSTRLMSLDAWVRLGKGTVLVLPDGHEHPAITKPFNRFIMHRLKYLMMQSSEQGSVRPRTIFFDELPTAGRIDVLSELLTKGRDYGITLSLGIQDIGQMRKEYGNEETDTIANSCGYRAYMKCKGSMADWCSQQIGKQMVEYVSPNASYSESRTDGQSETFQDQKRTWVSNYNENSGRTVGHSIVRSEQLAIMPSTFHQMRDIRSTSQVPGVYESPDGDIWKVNTPLRLLTEGFLCHVRKLEQYYRPAYEVQHLAREDQVLRPMNVEDCSRLGLPAHVVDEAPSEPVPRRRRRRAKPVRKRPPEPFS